VYSVFNSDGLLSTLEPCEPLPFNTSKLKDIPPDVFLQIMRLSGLTDEVSHLVR
jgi:hypothetical protein